jgi:hypothetical protein
MRSFTAVVRAGAAWANAVGGDGIDGGAAPSAAFSGHPHCGPVKTPQLWASRAC